MKDNNLITFLIILGLVGVMIFVYVKFVGAKPKDSIIMINGDPGCGKTSTGYYLCDSDNRKKRKITKIKNWFRKKFKKKEKEVPYLYSNIPLYNREYKEFTLDHLLRKKRFEYNSTIFLNECSLIADSMLAWNIGYDDARKEVNDKLKLFCKLIRHELKGKNICMVIDTQNPQDLALGFDRVLSNTNIILNWINWIPFVRPVKIRQIKINIDGLQNNLNKDAREDDSKWILVPKSVFKSYNSYCYEFLSRNLPIDKEVKYIKVNWKNRTKEMDKPFIIPTLSGYNEIIKSNEKLTKQKEEYEKVLLQQRQKEIIEMRKTALKEKKGENNGETK